jgi:methylmalonyl-CoA mutase cobalamin-binding domain/chain
MHNITLAIRRLRPPTISAPMTALNTVLEKIIWFTAGRNPFLSGFIRCMSQSEKCLFPICPMHNQTRKGAPMADDDIILSELSDDELVLQMHDDLYDGLKEEIEEAVNILIARGWTPYDVLTKALVAGMTIVGADFRDGILFVPEVLLAANAMKGGMFILKPLLVETGAPRMGKMVIGTVKGDIHDIGKNLVAMMMEGAGFEVRDLGINNSVEKYIAALEEDQPDILGMSALLTTTMPYMKVVIDTLKEKGMRDDYIVLVGGAPLNEEFGRAIGADAYCRDAAVAVETAKAWVARKHNQLRA